MPVGELGWAFRSCDPGSQRNLEGYLWSCIPILTAPYPPLDSLRIVSSRSSARRRTFQAEKLHHSVPSGGAFIGAGVGAFAGREGGEHIANTVRDDEQKKGEGEIAGEGSIDALFSGAGGLLKEGLELLGQARKLPIQATLTGMASNPELRNLALRVGGKTVVGAILYNLPKIPEIVKGVVLAKMGIEGPIWHDVVMLAQHPAIRNAAIDATQVMAKGAKVAPAAGAAVSAAAQGQTRHYVFDPANPTKLQPTQ